MASTATLLVVAVVLLTLLSTITADSSWRNARFTWFEVENGDLTTANCHYRWDQIKTGKYVGALSDTNPSFASSCGMCVEIRCQNAKFTDGYGNYIDRSSACSDTSKSVVVTIADACPCKFPNNQYSNQRWCCGDDPSRDHIDITKEAFEQLASTGLGVLGGEYRVVDCSTKGSSGGSSSGSNNGGSSSSGSSSQKPSSSSSSSSQPQQQSSSPSSSSGSSGSSNKWSGLLGNWWGHY